MGGYSFRLVSVRRIATLLSEVQPFSTDLTIPRQVDRKDVCQSLLRGDLCSLTQHFPYGSCQIPQSLFTVPHKGGSMHKGQLFGL